MTLIKDIINQNKRLAKISRVISELSDETQINAFLVGGCVRDLMLNPLAAVSYTHLTLPTSSWV